MKKKTVNIMEILKESPKGTKLYSPLIGECLLMNIDTMNVDFPIEIGKQTDSNYFGLAFTADGRYFNSPESECLLFPSKVMKDWNRFTWKTGDVLVSDDHKKELIFDGFSDDYGSFKGRHLLWTDDDGNVNYEDSDCLYHTYCYSKEDPDAAICYINTLNERQRAIFNPYTLEMDPPKMDTRFKPFDKVLVRQSKHMPWMANIFACMSNLENYQCISGMWTMCIPYEGNEHLLGKVEEEKSGD